FSAPFLLRLAPDTPSSSHTSAILHGITPVFYKQQQACQSISEASNTVFFRELSMIRWILLF
ncbi:MAG: hypothetical protein JXA18_09390, partial [Chitinispirillaceae bacterium]|nr:hypothetical protein [Chitinispirillaceae bacterium]